MGSGVLPTKVCGGRTRMNVAFVVSILLMAARKRCAPNSNLIRVPLSDGSSLRTGVASAEKAIPQDAPARQIAKTSFSIGARLCGTRANRDAAAAVLMTHMAATQKRCVKALSYPVAPRFGTRAMVVEGVKSATRSSCEAIKLSWGTTVWDADDRKCDHCGKHDT